MSKRITPQCEKLRPYQVAGVRWILKRKRVLLADEPGVGKTPQALVVKNARRPTYCVIISPKAMRSTWERQHQRWDLTGAPLKVIYSGKDTVSKTDRVIIITYSIACQSKWTKFLQTFLSAPGSLLIVDEVHGCKSWKSKRTKVIVRELAPCAEYLLLLTGTPMTKSVADLHPLFCMCEPKTWGKLHDFCYKYSYPIPTPFGSGVEFRGTRNITELKQRAKNFMIRRLLRNVCKELPEVSYQNVYLEIPKPVAKETMLDADAIKRSIEAGTGSGISNNQASMRRILGVAKLAPVYEWFDNFFEELPDEPIVVFAHHREVVRNLVSYFDMKDKRVTSISGETPEKEKRIASFEFQNGAYQVIVCNIVAGGIGIDLFRASRCFFVELDWTPTNLSQAISRLQRIGQTKNVQAFFMLAKDSIDDHVIDVITSKVKDISNVLEKSELKLKMGKK